MHKLNIILKGPESFINTLNEIKNFLKFNISLKEKDAIIYHQDFLKDKGNLDKIKEEKSIKILAANNHKKYNNFFDNIIELPVTLKELNDVVEKSFSKKQFNQNSSIKIKNYTLDKNERKLICNQNAIILTEKEIQLLELLVSNKKPISKDKILLKVWQYAPDADTHTVETHIYRLRKKINDIFSDVNFISNNKDGYYL